MKSKEDKNENSVVERSTHDNVLVDNTFGNVEDEEKMYAIIDVTGKEIICQKLSLRNCRNQCAIHFGTFSCCIALLEMNGIIVHNNDHFDEEREEPIILQCIHNVMLQDEMKQWKSDEWEKNIEKFKDQHDESIIDALNINAQIDDLLPLKKNVLLKMVEEEHCFEMIRKILAGSNEDLLSGRAFARAARANKDKIVSLFLDSGMNIRGPRVSEALQIACDLGHKNVVTVLLQHLADPNSFNFTADPPLVCAAARGYEDIVIMLLKAKADPNRKGSKSTRCIRPLKIASLEKYENIVAILLEYGAEPQ